jgi:transposase
VHGVVVTAVPWARHGTGHTLGFDQTVAWLATVCSKTAVVELMRIAWRSVGGIVARVWADTAGRVDLLAGLRRVGIDEISYRKEAVAQSAVLRVSTLDAGSVGARMWLWRRTSCRVSVISSI